MKKKLFPNRKPLTEEEVNELRRRYKKYCEENNIKVALKIPFDEEIVHAISKLKIPSLTDVAFFKSGEWKSFIKQLNE